MKEEELCDDKNCYSFGERAGWVEGECASWCTCETCQKDDAALLTELVAPYYGKDKGIELLEVKTL